MSVNIPGLALCSEDGGEGFKIPSFKEPFAETFTVPESHRYGYCRRIEEFERLNKVSEGSFGTVYRCRENRTGIMFDLQKFNISSEDYKNGVPIAALRQISILNALKTDNVVHSHGTVAVKTLESNYLILDCCPFTLDDLINKKGNKIYDESVVKGIMKQLLVGIDAIHKMSIIHRGINSQNIKFSDQGVLKIAGFESAQFYVKKATMSPDVNQLRYRAPELLLHSKTYTLAVDMWAAGCVFAELLFKTPIFSGNTEAKILRDILYVLGTPTEAIWPGYPEFLSQWKDGIYAIPEINKCSTLKEMLPGATEACTEMLMYLLIYFPEARLTSEESLLCLYFQENPQACSDLKEVLNENVENGSGVMPMDLC